MYCCSRLLDDDGDLVQCSIIAVSFNKEGNYWTDGAGTHYDPVTGFSQFGYVQLILTTLSETVEETKRKNIS